MKAARLQCCRCLWLPVVLAILTGCSLYSGSRYDGEEPPAAARRVIERLQQVNRSLTAFKGIGRIKLWDESREVQAINQRAAWVAAAPYKLRLAILASGRPVFKLAADGRYLYLVDLTNPDRSYMKMRATDPALKRLISLPVKSSDVVALLSGRTPMVEHSSAVLVNDADGDGPVLILQKWWTIVQKVYLSEDRTDVRRIEYFDYNGNLRYRVQLAGMQEISGYRVPMRLVFSNDKGIGLRVDVNRFIADASVTPSMFVLSPPQI
jgi:hypothetical protein